MANFALTFGQKYRHEPHPKAPAHPDGWITIVADDYDQARAFVVEVFGQQWSDLLAEGDFEGHYYPRGELTVMGPHYRRPDA